MELSLPADLEFEGRSVSDQIVETLRKLILDGTIAAGTHLREVALAKSFKVSRNTIRDAIQVLAREGLVQHDRYKGAIVAVLDSQDTSDLYRVRRLLELSATDHFDSMNATDVVALTAAFDRLAESVKGQDWQAIVDADLDFHGTIVGLHRSPRITRFYGTVKSEFAYCLSLIRLFEREHETPERIISEHRKILDAALEGDSQNARALLASHLAYYEQRVLDALRARDADSANSEEPGEED